ncbi:MAG: hypothetical protein HQK57_15360, partial [Deltaproteobacteria bacterium]|nr:hypothetical protein [Deltaproteobacteria bacterium]
YRYDPLLSIPLVSLPPGGGRPTKESTTEKDPNGEITERTLHYFLEAIAWFLLRQYRELIEDYKVFHRVYLRRINLLAAHKVVCKGNACPEELFLAAALLEDDLSGKLKRGETTENLERVKMEEPNPIFALVKSIINSGVSKKESKKEKP